jgi:hypothetical protein
MAAHVPSVGHRAALAGDAVTKLERLSGPTQLLVGPRAPDLGRIYGSQPKARRDYEIVDQGADDVPHDRTPLFDQIVLERISVSGCFRGLRKWFPRTGISLLRL